MRILHVVHQYYPEHLGGTESHTRALASAQVDAGHDVRILARRFAPGRRIEHESLDGLRVIRLTSGPFSPGRRFLATLREPYLAGALRASTAEFRPDVIHVQHPMGLPAGALASLRPPVPLVATLHDYWWVCANAQLYTSFGDRVCSGPQAWLNCARCGLSRLGGHDAWPLVPLVAPVFAARGLALRRLARRVSAWIAPSDFVRRWHVAHGFPAARTVTIAHGIDAPPADAVGLAAARPSGVGARRFAYLGGLSRQKGVHLLIDAFADMPPDARLVVAGDEAVFPDYCADLRRRSRHPGIRFLGPLGQADVWRTLARSDVLVVPSVWYETFSLIAQEALALGTPVVAADHGALTERVTHERNGLRVAPGDVPALRSALRRLAAEPDLLDRLRAAATPVRPIGQAAAEVEALYRAVIAR